MPARVNVGEREYIRMCDLSDQLLERDNETTPDYLNLKLQPYHLVFVYGSLKSDGSRHEILEDAPCLGQAYTVTKNWIMKSVRGDFPVIYPAPLGSEPSSGRVYGEVFVVPPERFLDLDRIEGNGTAYERQLLWVWLKDQSFPTKTGHGRPSAKCWTYVGLQSWYGQQSLSYMVRKESKSDRVPYGEKYFEWDNHPNTQLASMRSMWPVNSYPDLANDRLPF